MRRVFMLVLGLILILTSPLAVLVGATGALDGVSSTRSVPGDRELSTLTGMQVLIDQRCCKVNGGSPCTPVIPGGNIDYTECTNYYPNCGSAPSCYRTIRGPWKHDVCQFHETYKCGYKSDGGCIEVEVGNCVGGGTPQDCYCMNYSDPVFWGDRTYCDAVTGSQLCP